MSVLYFRQIGEIWPGILHGMERNNLMEPFRYKIRNGTLHNEYKCMIYACVQL